MRHANRLVALALCVVFGAVGQAYGSPLTLQIWGDADNLQILPNSAATIDVTNGFSGFTRTGGRQLEGGGSTVDSQQPVDSQMLVWATLYDGDKTLAWARFSAPVEGALSYEGMLGRYSGYAHGSASAVISIAQGVAPSLIPSWFTGLTATVDSVVTGGYLNEFQSTLTVSPGDAAAPVPEPSSVLVFLAAAGLFGWRRGRRE